MIQYVTNLTKWRFVSPPTGQKYKYQPGGSCSSGSSRNSSRVAIVLRYQFRNVDVLVVISDVAVDHFYWSI